MKDASEFKKNFLNWSQVLFFNFKKDFGTKINY